MFFIITGSQDNNGGFRMLRLNPPGNFYAVQLGHTSFHEYYVRSEFPCQPDRFETVVRFTNQFQVRFLLQDSPDALPDHVMAIGKKYSGLSFCFA
jgi:hypothetical protein